MTPYNVSIFFPKVSPQVTFSDMGYKKIITSKIINVKRWYLQSFLITVPVCCMHLHYNIHFIERDTAALMLACKFGRSWHTGNSLFTEFFSWGLGNCLPLDGIDQLYLSYYLFVNWTHRAFFYQKFFQVLKVSLSELELCSSSSGNL